MIGGRFFVSLREVNNSENILKVRSLLKESFFWYDDAYINDNMNELVKKQTEK